MQPESKAPRFFKTKLVLSAFIVFHLAAVVLTPHEQNYVSFASNFIFSPYVQFFELGSAWSYFAPDPGPPPVFIAWESYDAHGNELDSGRWPDLNDHPLLSERRVRRVALARFASPDDNRVVKMMLPYLCGRSPGIRSVRIVRQVYPTVLLQEVADGRRSLMDEKVVDSHVVGLELCEGQEGQEGG
jgi:hypothetical protein